jgi:hypothetical protein
VAVAAAAGWLFLFIVLLAVPPSPARRRVGRGAGTGDGTGDGTAPVPPDPGAEPPAVVSQLTGKLGELGFGVTLTDLAVRGWFQVSTPWGPAGPARCVVPAETPGGPLAPFERRVVAHVALRAGARGEVPAPALADGFEGGEDPFMKAFREEVDAETRRRGLTRSRLSAGRAGLLCLLAFVPAGALAVAAAAAHMRYPVAWGGGAWFGGCVVVLGAGASRKPSAAGRAALERWRSAVEAAPGDGRLLGYAAALGRAPGAVAVFGPPGKNTVWSGYRGSWQQLEIEQNTWSWPKGLAITLGIIVGPFAYFGVVFWLFSHGLGSVGKLVIELTVAAVIVAVGLGVARRSLFPRHAEFDGQVVRQWKVEGDSESPDEYHVAVDDGTRDKAWDFKVGSEPYRGLTPGTFVHVRVNLDSRSDVTVRRVEPPAVARPLARVAAEQQRAATGGLPDPADLVTADEAGAVLGGPVQGEHADTPSGRMMRWQLTRGTMPALRVYVRKAGSPVPPSARPVPGMADAYRLDQGVMLTVSPLTAIITLQGRARGGAVESLPGLLAPVEARLTELVRRSGEAGTGFVRHN